MNLAMTTKLREEADTQMQSMTKREVFHYFNQQIAQRCITHYGYEWGVTGKFCRITFLDDGNLDLWLCNPHNIAQGLGMRRLNRILSILSEKMPSGTPVRKLDGEAYTQGPLKDVVLGNLPLLGIFRKRRLSAEQRYKAATNLAKARAA